MNPHTALALTLLLTTLSAKPVPASSAKGC